MDTVPHSTLDNNPKLHYVYTLTYPESMGGIVFYVGKGKGNRIDTHERETENGGMSPKCQVIREIWANGEQIVKTKLAYFATDKEACAYETALIFFMDELTNLPWYAGAGTHRFIASIGSETTSQEQSESLRQYIEERRYRKMEREQQEAEERIQALFRLNSLRSK